MTNIAKIDKNFSVASEIRKDSLVFYSVEQEPFRVYGVKLENGKYRRMPEEVARNVSAGVYQLHTNTAGGRVRFITDSTCVAVHVEIADTHYLSHMTRVGVVGLDMYVREEGVERYCGAFIPPYDMEGVFESKLSFDEKKERIITINFPLYSSMSDLHIGLDEEAYVKKAPDYPHELPVVYYGSSITQGACASRPGLCYEHILTRKFDCNHINLGFSGCAKGEDTMTEYIRHLDMKAFVMDYDHNAETWEALQKTHEKMFCAIRESHPELPIIFMSRPKYFLTEPERKRLEIICATYEHAVSAGDKNVYLIDNAALTAECQDDGIVDRTHPNDSGFVSMARAISPVLGKILGTLAEK